MDATWTAGITAAADTGLAQSLFLHVFRVKKSRSKMIGTLVRIVALTCIANDSRLLHSVELGIVSQIPSPGNSAKSP